MRYPIGSDEARPALGDDPTTSDDDVPLAALVRPTLTTLRVNIAEMGRRGVERLIGLVQAGANAEADTACEIVRPALVVRQSTAAAATAGSNPDQTAASLS